jgi:hypothetical protein
MIRNYKYTQTALDGKSNFLDVFQAFVYKRAETIANEQNVSVVDDKIMETAIKQMIDKYAGFIKVRNPAFPENLLHYNEKEMTNLLYPYSHGGVK